MKNRIYIYTNTICNQHFFEKSPQHQLALVMVFALAVTVAADGADTAETAKGSITVDNPVAERTYTAYKIFDVVYDGAKKHYSYTIDGGDSKSLWYDTVSDYATDANGLKLTQVGGTNTYVVTFDKDKFSAPAFADALKKALADGSVTDNGTPLVTEGTSVSVKNLHLGYYFVTSTNGALCNLTTTNPDVTIHDKNDMPFNKVDDKVSAEVGQTAGGNSQFYFVTALPDSVSSSDRQAELTANGYTDAQIAAYAAVGGLPYLDNTDTVFGQVYQGMDVVDAMACVDTVKDDDGNDTYRPTEEAAITINSVTITTYSGAESNTYL